MSADPRTPEWVQDNALWALSIGAAIGAVLVGGALYAGTLLMKVTMLGTMVASLVMVYRREVFPFGNLFGVTPQSHLLRPEFDALRTRLMEAKRRWFGPTAVVIMTLGCTAAWYGTVAPPALTKTFEQGGHVFPQLAPWPAVQEASDWIAIGGIMVVLGLGSTAMLAWLCIHLTVGRFPFRGRGSPPVGVMALAAGVIAAACIVAQPSRAQQPTYRFMYDDLGRVMRVIAPDGDAVTYDYDAVGNIVAVRRGDACPLEPPSVTDVDADGCISGGSCVVSVRGGGMLGAGVTTDVDAAAISDCRAECTTVTCVLSIEFGFAGDVVPVRIVNALGAAAQAIPVSPPPVLEQPGQAGLWHFAGTAGDVVTLTMTRIANQPDGRSTLDPLFEVLDSRGFLVTGDDDSGSTLPAGPGRNAVVRDFMLPATDTYSVIARGVGGSSGPYVLDLMPPTMRLLPGVVIRPPEGGRELTFTGVVALPAERDGVTFAANAGERATIEVRREANRPDGSGSLDPAVELRDSRGFLVASDTNGGTNDPPGDGRNALLANQRLPATDAYRLVIHGEGSSTGPYTVRVHIAGDAAAAAVPASHAARELPSGAAK